MRGEVYGARDSKVFLVVIRGIVGWVRDSAVGGKYKTPTNQDGLPWHQTMKAHAWETVSVPAGQFRALRYTNMIQFQNDDIARTDAERQTTLRFAPQGGRRVPRESTAGHVYGA